MQQWFGKKHNMVNVRVGYKQNAVVNSFRGAQRLKQFCLAGTQDWRKNDEPKCQEYYAFSADIN